MSSYGNEILMAHEHNRQEKPRTRSPLSGAIENNDEYTVENLLENKADVNEKNVTGGSYLHNAVGIGTSFNIIRQLVEAKADLYCKEEETGYSPLRLAVSLRCDLKVVEFLVNADKTRESLDIPDVRGIKPEEAARLGSLQNQEVIDFLAKAAKERQQAINNALKENELLPKDLRDIVIGYSHVTNLKKENKNLTH